MKKQIKENNIADVVAIDKDRVAYICRVIGDYKSNKIDSNKSISLIDNILHADRISISDILYSRHKEIAGETWTNIKWLDDSYCISDHGRVFGKTKNKLMCVSKPKGTHSRIGLVANQEKQSFNIADLVGTSFLGANLDDGDVIYHIDRNKHNNCVDNLFVVRKGKFINVIGNIIDLMNDEVFVEMIDVPHALISNYGRVFSEVSMELMTISETVNGYQAVSIMRNGNLTNTMVHRGVANHFLPQPEFGKYIVHHKDSNKHNNHVSNLEWVTASQNTQHAISNMPSSFIRNESQFDMYCTLENGEEIAPCCVGNNDSYMITSFGRVYSNKTKLWLRQSENSNGYLRVEIRENDNRFSVMVHRLVAHAFVSPNYYTDLQVNHVDGNKKNNRSDNLEWVTASNNVSKRYHENNCGVRGNRKIAMTNDDLAEIRRLYATGEYTYKQIGAMYDVRLQTISNVVNRLGCYKDR